MNPLATQYSINKGAKATIAHYAGSKGAKAKPITKGDTQKRMQNCPTTSRQPNLITYHIT
jgi:hypothetical protein